MATTKPRKGSAEATRCRILNAAIKRFSKASYEQVGLRDIAADVGVDVALVHRAFGSKERLFEEAFAATEHFVEVFETDKDQWGGIFAKLVFDHETAGGASAASALQIFVHSLSSPRAKEVFRSFAEKGFVDPIAAQAGDPGRQRAALFVACLVGLTIARNVLALEPLDNAARDESEPLIRALLEFCLGEDKAG